MMASVSQTVQVLNSQVGESGEAEESVFVDDSDFISAQVSGITKP